MSTTVLEPKTNTTEFSNTNVSAASEEIAFQETTVEKRIRVRQIILRYAAGFACCWLVLNLGLYRYKTGAVTPSPAGRLQQKLAYYARHANEFNLVFTGDSRTYCAMHPDLIDAELGSKSINLAHWAHWFPTQYSHFQDLLPLIPKGTTIVWSVGHQNFKPVHKEVGTVYPLRTQNLPTYLNWGYELGDVTNNLLFFHPATNVIGWMPRLRSKLDQCIERPLWGKSVAQTRSTSESELQIALKRYQADDQIVHCEVMQDHGQPTSLALYKRNGAYARVEIDHEFFRQKQNLAHGRQAKIAADEQAGFVPAQEYWQTFLAILKLCKKHKVQLVVNEIEEAPHQYPTPEHKEYFRKFMRDQVQQTVEQHGFDYLRVDFDQLTDADYFDYNHLNSRGIEHFTPLLAAKLREVIRLDSELSPTTLQHSVAQRSDHKKLSR